MCQNDGKNKALPTLLLECQESKFIFPVLHHLINVVEWKCVAFMAGLFFCIHALPINSSIRFGRAVCLTLGSYNFSSRSCLRTKGAHCYCARQIHVATSRHVINQASEKGRSLRITHRALQRVCYLRVQFTPLNGR